MGRARGWLGYRGEELESLLECTDLVGVRWLLDTAKAATGALAAAAGRTRQTEGRANGEATRPACSRAGGARRITQTGGEQWLLAPVLQSIVAACNEHSSSNWGVFWDLQRAAAPTTDAAAEGGETTGGAARPFQPALRS